MIVLGNRIKELRQRDGKTQGSLAGALGVTAQVVSRWEKGICYPDMELIPSIANCFGVSIDELFGYDNERSKKIDALFDRITGMNRNNDGVECAIIYTADQLIFIAVFLLLIRCRSDSSPP